MDVAEISRLAAYEDWYWWHRARRRIIDRLLQRALGEGDATRRILDVGAGTGATSQALRKYGRVMAVDLSTEATIVARRRGLDVARMDAGNLAFPDASFDVVVVLDVIEHLEDDAAAVRELRRVLKPGGVLLATVPAYKWLWSSHDVANHHFRRYRQSELRRLLRGGDFHVEVCSYVMMSMLIPAAAYRLLEHLPGRKVADDEAHVRFTPVPPLINWALSHVAAWGGYFAGRVWLPFGLSIAAVARKPLDAPRAASDESSGTPAGRPSST
ncbi:MAG: class I SAM-dependent methyltransferase [Chloroflexi bacterium]|nr:MAG: class I SAM-dependent methyltransferase [Chloroflexota bacterium]